MTRYYVVHKSAVEKSPSFYLLNTLNKVPEGVKNTEHNASLIKRKDGSIRLIYSTKTDIEYVSYQDRQYLKPVPTDPDMFRLTRAQWTNLLACDNTVRAALTFNASAEAEQRQYKLNQVKRDELMYALRSISKTLKLRTESMQTT